MKTLQDHYRALDPNRAGYIEFAIAAYKALDEDASGATVHYAPSIPLSGANLKEAMNGV